MFYGINFVFKVKKVKFPFKDKGIVFVLLVAFKLRKRFTDPSKTFLPKEQLCWNFKIKNIVCTATKPRWWKGVKKSFFMSADLQGGNKNVLSVNPVDRRVKEERREIKVNLESILYIKFVRKSLNSVALHYFNLN